MPEVVRADLGLEAFGGEHERGGDRHCCIVQEDLSSQSRQLE